MTPRPVTFIYKSRCVIAVVLYNSLLQAQGSAPYHSSQIRVYATYRALVLVAAAVAHLFLLYPVQHLRCEQAFCKAFLTGYNSGNCR